MQRTYHVRHAVAKGRDAGDERPGLEPKRCGVWSQGRDPHGSLLPAARGGEQWTPQPHQSPAGRYPQSRLAKLVLSYQLFLFAVIIFFSFTMLFHSFLFLVLFFFFFFCLDFLKFKVSIVPPSSFFGFYNSLFTLPSPDISYFFARFFVYFFQHCYSCRPSDYTVSEDAGIEPRTVATLALAVRLSCHWAISHSHWTRSHPHWARCHLTFVMTSVGCRLGWESTCCQLRTAWCAAWRTGTALPTSPGTRRTGTCWSRPSSFSILQARQAATGTGAVPHYPPHLAPGGPGPVGCAPHPSASYKPDRQPQVLVLYRLAYLIWHQADRT